MKKITSNQINSFEDFEKLKKVVRTDVELKKKVVAANVTELKKDLAVTAVLTSGLKMALNLTGLKPLYQKGAALAGSVATNTVVKKMIPDNSHVLDHIQIGVLQALSKGSSGLISVLRLISNGNGSAELKLKGNIREKLGLLKVKYAHLTDDDLLYLEGKEDQLIGRLKVKLGKSREEVIRLLNSL